MPIQQLNRTSLNGAFANGVRPTGDDFASAWLSCLNQTDDGLSISDAVNKNLKLAGGVTLGSPSAGDPGTLRYDTVSAQIQYTSDGKNFKSISSNAGAFSLVQGSTSAVAYAGGNVGIGTFSSPPTHLLEIPLGDNSGAAQQILLGNLVIHNGLSTSPITSPPGAYIGNNAFLALNNIGYALFQDGSGNTKITGSNTLALTMNNIEQLIISNSLGTTSMLIQTDVTIGTPSANSDLNLRGDAFKTGSAVWQTLPGSDARIKKDIKDYEEGLDKVIQLKPVIYKFNGKGGSFEDGKDYIGFIAQDVQKVVPEMVFSKLAKLNPEDEKEIELLNYDFHNVLFMFINAFKELNARIEKLEKPKTNEKRKTGNSPGADH